MRFVDLLEWRDAHGAAGTVDQLDLRRQEAVDPVLDDRVRLSAADLHERPRPGGDAPDLGHDRPRQAPVAILVEILHASACGASSSPSWPSSSRSRYVR